MLKKQLKCLNLVLEWQGTTTEKGLVESYFANPLDQYKKKETDILIEKYFDTLYSTGVK